MKTNSYPPWFDAELKETTREKNKGHTFKQTYKSDIFNSQTSLSQDRIVNHRILIKL